MTNHILAVAAAVVAIVAFALLLITEHSDGCTKVPNGSVVALVACK